MMLVTDLVLVSEAVAVAVAATEVDQINIKKGKDWGDNLRSLRVTDGLTAQG